MFRQTLRSVRFWWQRRTRGFDDSETWSLDWTLSKHILPRLIRFKELSISRPPDFSDETWNLMLDKMISAFAFLGSDARWDSYDEEDWREAQEGVELFAKHFTSLWW